MLHLDDQRTLYTKILKKNDIIFNKVYNLGFILIFLALTSLCFADEKTDQLNQTKMQEKTVSVKTIRSLRKQAAWRKRLIWDNDGCDILYLAKEPTPAGLLEVRFNKIPVKQIDCVTYSTALGFSQFMHNTKIGEIFTYKETVTNDILRNGQGFSKNLTKDLIAQGTDPLEVGVNFCHKNDLECFWTFRMNDTHDCWRGWYSPYVIPEFVKTHPELLVAKSREDRKFGGYRAVDYSHKQIRDMAVAFAEEVCQNYKVDGIVLDFFRHLAYFRNFSIGKSVTLEELNMLTEMMQQIRKVVDRESIKQNRIILLAIRVPDSLECCRAIGFDLSRWMREGLIDMLFVSGYFRLNPWERMIILGHRYDVPVYATLSDSRVKDIPAHRIRCSMEAYLARGVNAWAAGVDGIYMFNGRPLGVLESPEKMVGLNKIYTTGARNGKAAAYWIPRGDSYLNRQIISPDEPMKLPAGKASFIELNCNEDFDAAEANGKTASCVLQLRIDTPPTRIFINDNLVAQGTQNDIYIDYKIKVGWLKKGLNIIKIISNSNDEQSLILQDILLRVTYQ